MIRVHNAQRRMRVDLRMLQRFAYAAHQAALQTKPRESGVLHDLIAVDVILVSDRRIADLHKRFMDIEGPTDVITFQHGEIFISVDTANAHARRFRSTTTREIRLYIAHGLLHLLGYDDTTSAASRGMAKAQARLVAAAEAAM